MSSTSPKGRAWRWSSLRELISFEEAKSVILSAVKPVEDVERVRLSGAAFRVLAEDVRAPSPFPPFDRSTMDGFAARASDIEGASMLSPAVLKLKPDGPISSGECCPISTGNPMPEGADCVVPLEFCERRNGEVLVKKSVPPWANVARKGSSVGEGDLLLPKGSLLDFAAIASLACLGVGEVPVYRKPLVKLISMGDELIPPGSPPEEGKVYDSNTYFLKAFCEKCGCEVDAALLPDSRELLKRALKNRYDVAILSSGTSVGEEDIVLDVLEKLGAEFLFRGMRCKPGKPTSFANLNGKPVFALPGNPFSAMAVFKTLVEPALLKMGHLPASQRKERLPMAGYVVLDPGKTNILPVRIEGGKAHPLPVPSWDVVGARGSDGIAIIPEGIEYVQEGDEVEVIFWY